MRAYFCQCMKMVWKSFSWEVFDLFYVYMLKCVFLTTRENVDKGCLMKTTLSGQRNNFQTTYSKIKTKNKPNHIYVKSNFPFLLKKY